MQIIFNMLESQQHSANFPLRPHADCSVAAAEAKRALCRLHGPSGKKQRACSPAYVESLSSFFLFISGWQTTIWRITATNWSGVSTSCQTNYLPLDTGAKFDRTDLFCKIFVRSKCRLDAHILF